MDVSEIALLYAGLLDALNDHPGIGLVLAVENGRPVIVTSRGTSELTAARLPPSLAEPEQCTADLVRLLSFPHAGDLVVVGAWNAHGRVVTFEEQSHPWRRRGSPGLSLLPDATGIHASMSPVSPIQVGSTHSLSQLTPLPLDRL